MSITIIGSWLARLCNYQPNYNHIWTCGKPQSLELATFELSAIIYHDLIGLWRLINAFYFEWKGGDKQNSSSCQKGILTKRICYLVKSCTGVIRVILKILVQMILPGCPTIQCNSSWGNNFSSIWRPDSEGGRIWTRPCPVIVRARQVLTGLPRELTMKKGFSLRL